MTEIAYSTLADESAGAAQGFRVPRFEVSIDGAALISPVVRDVIEVTYQDKIQEISQFEMVVNNWDTDRRRYKYIGSEDPGGTSDPVLRELEQLFEPCKKEVKLKLGYGSELIEMMTGTFTTMEPTFSAGGPHTLSVRALNVLHRLRRKKYDGHWENRTDSFIAKSFDGKVDPKWKNSGQDARRIPMPVEVDKGAKSTEVAIPFVTQKNEYDVDFLWRRAAIRCYIVEIARKPDTNEKFLYFGPSDVRGPVNYTLSWGSGLTDIKLTLTTANQVKQVTVRGWDRARQKPIEEKVDWTDKELKKLNPSLGEIVMQCDPREERVVTLPVFTKSDARAHARDILKGHAQDLVKAQGSTVGLPRLRAGSKLKLLGIGGRLSGTYFVTETTHTLNQSGYITRFTARREDPDTGLTL